MVSDFEMYSYYMANGTLLSKIDRRELEWFSPSGDSCWFMITIDGCLSEDTYVKGLGGPYYSCDNPFSLGSAERKLVYYKKGETVWGIPLTITGISNTEITREIIVFPNPAKDNITIKVGDINTGKLMFYLFDLSGRLIISEPINTVEKQFRHCDFQTGYLFLHIERRGQGYV